MEEYIEYANSMLQCGHTISEVLEMTSTNSVEEYTDDFEKGY